MKYRVYLYMDDVYKVVAQRECTGGLIDQTVFKGSLSDCESYIRLNENGYMQ